MFKTLHNFVTFVAAVIVIGYASWQVYLHKNVLFGCGCSAACKCGIDCKCDEDNRCNENCH